MRDGSRNDDDDDGEDADAEEGAAAFGALDDEDHEDEELDEDGDLDDASDPDDPDGLDEDFPLGDGTAMTEGEVWCPYCGQPNEVSLDPGSGAVQEYVEDCQVCCRPWRVSVRYHGDGTADVRAVASDDDDGW